MKSWILPVVSFVLIAALGYVVHSQAGEIERLTRVVEGDAGGEPGRGKGKEEGAVARAAADDTRGVAVRLASLEAEVSGLRSRLNRCEFAVRSLQDGAFDQGPSGSRGARAAAAAGGNQLEYTILEMLDSERGGVRDRLREVIKEEREAEHEERIKQREQRWRERTEGVLDQLADETGLREAVRQGILNLLQAEWDQIRESFRTAHERGDFDEARDKAIRVRQETDRQVRELVDEQQYQAYRRMREEELGAFRFGRRGGPPREREARPE